MTPSLQFLGAARTVTGSKHMMLSGGHEVLVDAGLFQGRKKLRERNWEPMPLPPEEIDAIVLTHGHIDHCGYLPRLVQQGFKRPVFCTNATANLLELMLPDSAKIQEEQAAYANRKGFSKHHPALPLYTGEEALAALELVQPVPYGESVEVVKGMTCTFFPTGHILGSSFVQMDCEGLRTVFSGDLGGYDNEVMKPPAPLPANVDYILTESTYGGRKNDEEVPIREQLKRNIQPVLAAGGVVVIPAFAVGRSTLVLYHLRRMMEAGDIPEVPVFLDSPMATTATRLYCQHGSDHNMSIDLLRDTLHSPIQTKDIRLVRSVEESKQINEFKGPGVIISASGMATAGRVLHHLQRRLPHKENMVLLVGYQAEGTRGRHLLEGAEHVRIFGKDVRVKAQVASIRGLSAHGDSDDIIRWLKTAQNRPRRVFLVHGEPDSLAAMAERVDTELGFPNYTPDYMEKVPLDDPPAS